jgi:hypothetical protein
MDLVEKLRAILTAEFPPPATISLDDDDGIIGIVVSPRFKGMDAMDRVNLIWDLLGSRLTPEERRRVLTVVAATPEEEIFHSHSV